MKATDFWRAIDHIAASQRLTPSALARKAGLDPTTFSRSKRHDANGRERWPASTSVAALLEAVGMSLPDFAALVENTHLIVGLFAASEAGTDRPASARALRQRPLRSDRPAILLVDDDEELRTHLGDFLKSAGFEVFGAADHQEALRIIESGQRLDLLMTDLVLPNGISGFATARMAQIRRPDLSVLYMTGYDIPANAADAKSLVLRKPLTAETTIKRIELLLA